MNYHRFVTLKRLSNMIYEKINRRRLSRPGSRQIVNSQIKRSLDKNENVEDSKEIKMGSARIKGKKQEIIIASVTPRISNSGS